MPTLRNWLFDLDTETDGSTIARAVLAIADDPAAARARVQKALEFVRRRQRETMAVLRKELDR
jgi:hypothetical protein